ncbi:hypothetical protein ANN_11833 [Periplaneta americana]|uniref:Uncharacterized protein n=1 Tax=Periplaneta americana TaxID=6978 RepID=A0ABQ8T656_PERAM|nr:hypothetical protein ANN_11833 [Periplaneta americana]
MSPGSNTESYPAFAHIGLRENPGKNLNQSSGRQHSLTCAMGTRCRPVCTVVQQGDIECIPASSYESTIVHCVFRGKAATRQMGARNHHVGPVHRKENTRQAKKKMDRYIQAAAGRELVNHRPQQERVETDSEQTHIDLKFDKL